MDGKLTPEEQAELDGLNTSLNSAEQKELDELNGVSSSPKPATSPQGAESGVLMSSQAPKPKSRLSDYTGKPLTPISPFTSELGSTSSVGGKSKAYEPTIQDVNAKITDVTLRQKFPEYGKQKSFAEASKEIALQKTEQEAQETEQRRKQRRLELIPQQIKKINEDKVALLKENTFEARQKLGAMAAVEKKLSTELEQENKVKYPELQNMPKKVVAGIEDEIHEYLNSDPYIKSKIEKVGATDEVMNELLMKATQKKTAPLIQDINLFKEEGTVDIAKQKTDIAKQIGATQSELQQLATQINEIQDKELNQKGYKDLSLQLTKQQNKVNSLSPEINKLNNEYKSFSPELLQIENKLKAFEPKIKDNTFTGNSEEYRLYQQLQSDYNGLLSKRNEIVSNPSNVAYAKEIENLNTLVNQKNDLVKGLQNTTYNATVAKYELAKGKYDELNNKYSEFDTPEINERLGKYYQTANKLNDLTSKYESARGNIASVSEIENAQAKVNKEQGIGADIGARSVNSILSAASSLVAYPFREAASWHGEDGKYHYSDMIADWIDSGNKPFLTNKNNDFVNAETGNINWGVAPVVGSLADNLGIIVTLALTGKFATPVVAEGLASTAPTLMEAEKATELAKVYTTVIPAYMSSFHQSMQEAKEMGFTGAGAQVFGRTMAMLEGVSELISPDQELVFGKGAKNAMLKEFIENYAKSGKEASKKLVIDFVNNVGGEISEEYAIMLGKTLGSTIGHAVDSDIDVYLPTINEVTSTAVTSGALGGVMGSFGQYAESKQLNSIGKLQFAKNFEQGKDILDGLKEKGAITQEKYDKVINETQKYQSVLGQIPEGISDYKKAAIVEKLLEIKAVKEGMPKEQSDVFEKIANKKIADIQKGIEAIIDDADFDKNAEAEVKKEIEKQDKVVEPIKFTSPTNEKYGYVEENGVKRNLTKEEFDNYDNRVVEQQMDNNGEKDNVQAVDKVAEAEQKADIERRKQQSTSNIREDKLNENWYSVITNAEGNVVTMIQSSTSKEQLIKNINDEYDAELVALKKPKVQGGEDGVQKVETLDNYEINDVEIPDNIESEDEWQSKLVEKAFEDTNLKYSKKIAGTGTIYYTFEGKNGDDVVVRLGNHSKGRWAGREVDANVVYDANSTPQDVLDILRDKLPDGVIIKKAPTPTPPTSEVAETKTVTINNNKNDKENTNEANGQVVLERLPKTGDESEVGKSSEQLRKEEIAQLRAKEQAEYDAMSNPNDKVKQQEIYDRYDKLITPLLKDIKYLEAKAKETPNQESRTEKKVEQEKKEIINNDNNEADNIQPNGEVYVPPTTEAGITKEEARIAEEEKANGTEKGNLKLSDIGVRPDVFQFKSQDEESGVNLREKISKTQAINPIALNVLHVWQDVKGEIGEKGKVYIVDGHHRLDFLKAKGVKNADVHFVNAETAKGARTQAAFANIIGGRGTSVDAAKVIKDATPEQLKDYNPNSKVFKEGKELANLTEPLFNLVSQEKLDIPTAIAISKVPKELQEAFYKKVKRNEASGAIKMTPKGLLEMADMIVGGNAAAKEMTQMDIFGNTEEQELLVFEQAQLQSDIKEELAKDAKILGSANKNKEVLEKANNVLDLEANAKLAQSSKLASGLFDTYKNRKNIAEIIKKATLDLSNTKNRKQRAEIKEKATSEVKKAIEIELKNDFNGGKEKEVTPLVVEKTTTDTTNPVSKESVSPIEKIKEDYKEITEIKSERAKNNAKERFINSNFDSIVAQLMLKNKIKRKC